MKAPTIQLLLAMLFMVLAGIGPNLFPAAQAGYVQLSLVAYQILIPSILGIALLIILIWRLGYTSLLRQVLVGIAAGVVGTIGLEVVRIIGFELGWMPGELPKLMGVLLLDQFATGPDVTSNVAGWAYHFWNGAAFGILFSLLISKTNIFWGLAFGVLIGIGFMVSPVVKSLGIGLFGVEYKDGYQFMVTVTLAHAAFGILVGWVTQVLTPAPFHIVNRVKAVVTSTHEPSF